jgi:hypothetical protein
LGHNRSLVSEYLSGREYSKTAHHDRLTRPGKHILASP